MSQEKIFFNYCERSSLDFFSEPLNSLTNFFFILVSIILLYQYPKRNKYIALIIFFIGVSSFLFHTIPISLFGLLDIFFIMTFIVFYICFLMKLFFNYSLISSIIYAHIFLIICYIFGKILDDTILGTTAFYIPIVLIIYLFYFLSKKRQNLLNSNLIQISALVFSLSTLFRFLDLYLCSNISIGTHFIWHILNSLTLFLLAKFYYLNSTEPPQKNQPNPR